MLNPTQEKLLQQIVLVRQFRKLESKETEKLHGYIDSPLFYFLWDLETQLEQEFRESFGRKWIDHLVKDNEGRKKR